MNIVYGLNSTVLISLQMLCQWQYLGEKKATNVHDNFSVEEMLRSENCHNPD